MGVIGVVGYLMDTGFSALNVQVVPGPIHPRIISSDLAVENLYHATQQLDQDGLLTTTKNSGFRESSSGNSVLNTISRNLFIATEEVPMWCEQSDDYQYPFKYVFASYGFAPRTWQQYALSKALEPTASVQMSMNAAESDLSRDEELPMNQSIAANLAVYVVLVSNSFFGWRGAEDEAWNSKTSVDTTSVLPMADHFNLTIGTRSSANATFLSSAHELIVDYFSKAENASVTDELASIEFSHFNVSDTVEFDALTIEIPTQKYGEQEVNSSSSNPFYQSLPEYLCNAEACLVPDAMEYTEAGAMTTIYPRVQALAICLNEAGGEDLVVDFTYYEPNQVLQSCKERSNTL